MTEAEHVLTLKAQGLSVRAIATKMHMSKSAVQRIAKPVPAQILGRDTHAAATPESGTLSMLVVPP
jgi:DNA invertase Pin-like site-specific DNA recombinase